MQQFKGLILDLDGTLVDSLDSIPDAYIATVREVSGRTCTFEEIVSTLPIGPGEAILTALLGRPSTSEDLACYHRHFEAAISGVTCYPGVPEALRRVAASVPVAVFTGGGRTGAELLLGHTSLPRYLSALVCGDEVERSKPAPDGVWAACEALRVAPAEAAYVGDARRDLESAKAAGVVAVAAGWGHEYDATAPADVVLDTPSDLVALILGSATDGC
jgi:HAD superfamily hydrolase (TIGR01509 family)